MDHFTENNVGVQVVVGATNVLTVLGSLVIIASYACFRSLRTRARLVLFHLSLMDLAVGLAHFAGGVSDLNALYNLTKTASGENYYSVSVGVKIFCKFHAFVGYYAIISSVLWTVALSVYMYLLNEHRRRTGEVMKYFIWPSSLACYGIPLVLTVWAQFTGRLGYAPYDSAGWCTLITINPITDKHDSFVSVFGFDLWIYLSIVVITVLYVSNVFHLRTQKDRKRTSILSTIDYKFIFIPVIFVFLRIWTCILDLLYYIYGNNNIPEGVVIPFVLLTGVGDSAQGFVNALLFVFFTKPVRKAFWDVICLRCKRARGEELDPVIPETSGEASAKTDHAGCITECHIIALFCGHRFHPHEDVEEARGR